jgi:hypothetical protein
VVGCEIFGSSNAVISLNLSVLPNHLR